MAGTRRLKASPNGTSKQSPGLPTKEATPGKDRGDDQPQRGCGGGVTHEEAFPSRDPRPLPQRRWRCNLINRLTRGSSCLATPGFVTLSRWDRELAGNLHTDLRLGEAAVEAGGLDLRPPAVEEDFERMPHGHPAEDGEAFPPDAVPS